MATFTNETIHTASFTSEIINTSGATIATAGQVMGLLLALVYAGGEILQSGTLPTFINETIN
jgi:hypothetical protein